MDLNKAMLIGRLTKDPESRATQGGQSVANFSLATNYVFTDATGQKQEKVEFHNIVAWRKLADICNQYLKKGSRVYVEGRMQTRSWQDPNGVTKNKMEITADNLIMLDSKGAGASGSVANTFTPKQTANSNSSFPANSSAPVVNNSGEEEIRVEDIPF